MRYLSKERFCQIEGNDVRYRSCLKCGSKFKTDRYHRICETCTETNKKTTGYVSRNLLTPHKIGSYTEDMEFEL